MIGPQNFPTAILNLPWDDSAEYIFFNKLPFLSSFNVTGEIGYFGNLRPSTGFSHCRLSGV